MYKRHPATRQMTYINSANSNPVATIGIEDLSLSDIESVEVHNGGTSLTSGATGSSVFVVKPRDWADLRDALNSGVYSDPTYYTFVNEPALVASTGGKDIYSTNYELWMASPPATGGTNAIRIVHYGVEPWNTTTDAPCFGTELDTLFTLKIAHYLRIQKDLEVNDLLYKMAPLERRLLQSTWEPKPEKDYQIPVAGAEMFRTKYSTRTGWVRKY